MMHKSVFTFLTAVSLSPSSVHAWGPPPSGNSTWTSWNPWDNSTGTPSGPASGPHGHRLSIIPSQSNVKVNYGNGTDKRWPWQSYVSSPYRPPVFNITGSGGPLAEGYVFITPSNASAIGQGGAAESAGFLLTSAGDLVYTLPVSGIDDFRKQTYNGREYLTYWSGRNSIGLNVGHGYGNVTFIDEQYNNFTVNPDLHVNQLSVTSGGSIDLHEAQLTKHNTLLVTAYNNTPYDLSALGGPENGWIVTTLVFELDIATQQVLFEWNPVEHVALSTSKVAIGPANISEPWDWIHINSAQRVGDNYLINSRHTWTTYLVSKNGSIIWSFEGETGGDFGAPPANGTFRWQHFVRAHNVTATSLDLSIFDNHANGPVANQSESKAIVFHLELPPNPSVTPLLKRRLTTPSQPLYVDSQGSYIVELSNGNQFVGYGQLPISREYGPATDGSDLRWEAQFGGLNNVQSYRGFKETWRGTPAAWDPSLVVVKGQAYVSWNGATEVRAWNVYVNGTAVGVALKKGFETKFAVPASAAALQVGALQEGREVRRSNTVQI